MGDEVAADGGDITKDVWDIEELILNGAYDGNPEDPVAKRHGIGNYV